MDRWGLSLSTPPRTSTKRLLTYTEKKPAEPKGQITQMNTDKDYENCTRHKRIRVVPRAGGTFWAVSSVAGMFWAVS